MNHTHLVKSTREQEGLHDKDKDPELVSQRASRSSHSTQKALTRYKRFRE
jgi:hypothetical protein